MRMEIVTDDNMISLGIAAKLSFIEGVLVSDENDGTYDTLQTVKEDTLDKIKSLPVEHGFTQQVKDGMIKAFEKMEIGRKFLCLNKWVTNYQSDEAKLYWKVQKLCNEGHTLAEASVLGNNWLERTVNERNDKEYGIAKEQITNHLTKKNTIPLIVVVNSKQVKIKLEEEFKNELDKFVGENEVILFSTARQNGIVLFKIFTVSEYERLDELIKQNADVFINKEN